MKYIINGGNALTGHVNVNSAKNALLVQMASAVLASGTTTINNVDKIDDVMVMAQLLQQLGCIVMWNDKTISIDATNISSTSITQDIATQMRGSIFLLGALLGRMHSASTYMPGGCAIGTRPIDIHLDALSMMGVSVDSSGQKLLCSADRLHGADITLRMPSVGATENIIMCAVLAQGKTTIHNCAIEPEVVALQNSLIDMGANISGIGTRHVTVVGVKTLHGATIDPIADRIVAATYAVATCMTHGDVTIHNCCASHIEPLLDVMVSADITVEQGNNSIRVISNGYNGLGNIHTAPYPLFPTDMQSLVLSMATIARGSSSITENLFENRLVANCNQLQAMGANISLVGNCATIQGVICLKASQLRCTDLRGGAGLVLASLCATGTSVIHDIYHINRGYYQLHDALTNIGAKIEVCN